MKNRVIACLAAAALLGLAAAAGAQEADHAQADHSMHASGELELQRPADRNKWESDESLREGMRRLSAAFEAHHAAYREDRFGSEQAEQLAASIDDAVNFMFANCRLPADADAELHKLLAAALGAARHLRESDEPHRGLHRLQRVLQAYPDHFEHPDWSGPA
jgi:hypothetical protein